RQPEEAQHTPTESESSPEAPYYTQIFRNRVFHNPARMLKSYTVFNQNTNMQLVFDKIDNPLIPWGKIETIA
ncbi:hypothetical protein, partial [Halobacillus sp. BBL2006]|uniref:hypothetical protein n=1 Tax=Halobacillus sp. BBL2006 TaxID=1543706 RepID=UPI000543FFCA